MPGPRRTTTDEAEQSGWLPRHYSLRVRVPTPQRQGRVLCRGRACPARNGPASQEPKRGSPIGYVPCAYAPRGPAEVATFMKLLAVGDMHLGRRPSRLPSELAHGPSELGPAAAWRHAVDHAIREKIDAVLLAGDVIESEKDFFEGFHQLKQGVDKLTATGIQVIAVAGNHDVLVLPKLADLLEGSGNFKLLGRGGNWEVHETQAKGDQLTLWGWSFPKQEVTNSPLAEAKFDRHSGVQLGLLHCDLDRPGSPYAPVSRSELRASGLDGWLLGHIHTPDNLRPDSLCGYLGCLSGMDPGEFGPRGPWILNIKDGQLREVSQVPLAPLRWLRSELDISEVEHLEDLDSCLTRHISELHKDLSAEAFPPKAVGIRLTLVGRSHFAKEISRWIEDSSERPPRFMLSDTDYFVEHCSSAVLPEIDLEELARQRNPLGLLAQNILLLNQPPQNPERMALVSAARSDFASSLQNQNWRKLESNAEKLDEDAVIEQLRHAGIQAINELYAQQLGASK